ncbi:L,D-transpeptidase family protein [Geomonas sp. Red32]|uniref:L,D-transpeptidase family protein n=1 Tax=Geomonas sp. Red32 TaxID=2912856 RepID=UPI00202CFD24|nr:L,D-transpeptidase family protein [Geomonas sp. Red32]
MLDALLKGGASKKSDAFRALIDTYFSGVRCLEGGKPELAAEYFTLVERYGKSFFPGLLSPSKHSSHGGHSAPVPQHTAAAEPAVSKDPIDPSAPKVSPAPEPPMPVVAQKVVLPAASVPAVPPAVQVPDTPQVREPEKQPIQVTEKLPVQVAEKLPVQVAEKPPVEVAEKQPVQVAEKQPVQEPETPAVQAQVVPPQPEAARQPEEPPQAMSRPSDQDNEDDDADDDSAAPVTAWVAGSRVIGGERLYRVEANETLQQIARRQGMTPRLLARLNRLAVTSRLHRGQTLRIVNRHIIPEEAGNGLLVNIADCTLYSFRDHKLVRTVPIAAGKPGAGEQKGDWQTPTGTFTVVAKVKDPSWKVPVSIRREMERLGHEVKTRVPPGPANPLGKYALRTSLPGILIHGTNRPASISSYTSHGCIRVGPADIETLYHEVPLKTQGKIVYRPIKVAVGADGRIFLEVHRDVYGKIGNLEREARSLIEEAAGSAPVDWRKVKEVIKDQTGVAEVVSAQL